MTNDRDSIPKQALKCLKKERNVQKKSVYGPCT